jgi:tetratricopeptide (TPR) repeat protein
MTQIEVVNFARSGKCAILHPVDRFLQIARFSKQPKCQQALNQIALLLKIGTELNPEIPELYVFKGIVNLFLEFDISESEKNLKRALKLNPNSTNGHYRYAELLVYSGRFSGAVSQIEACIRLSPLSSRSNKNIAKLLYCMEKYEESIAKSAECLELKSEDFEAHLFSAVALTELGEYDKAQEAYLRSLALQNHWETISMIGYTNALSGNVNEAKGSLRQLKRISKRSYVSPMNYAIVYSGLGNNDETFKCLKKAFGEHNSDLIAVKSDPRLKSLRKDGRFTKMLCKIELSLN